MSWTETKVLMDGHDEILEKLDVGGTAQTKKFTETVTGVLRDVAQTFTGSGRFVCWANSSNGTALYATVDGIPLWTGQDVVLSTANGNPVIEIYFEKSITVNSSYQYGYINYFVQT